jgi:hypothetical protein
MGVRFRPEPFRRPAAQSAATERQGRGRHAESRELQPVFDELVDAWRTGEGRPFRPWHVPVVSEVRTP